MSDVIELNLDEQAMMEQMYTDLEIYEIQHQQHNMRMQEIIRDIQVVNGSMIAMKRSIQQYASKLSEKYSPSDDVDYIFDRDNLNFKRVEK